MEAWFRLITDQFKAYTSLWGGLGRDDLLTGNTFSALALKLSRPRPLPRIVAHPFFKISLLTDWYYSVQTGLERGWGWLFPWRVSSFVRSLDAS
ncbi:hypothetical protein PSCICN_22870 [Pseudomonas cichorii]|nr:hypothetical protein PSCICN_22870 [Pseudomonas cichorii]